MWLPGSAPLMGVHWALQQVAGRFGAVVAQQALHAQPYVAVALHRGFRQQCHGGQVAYAVGHKMPPLVTGELVQARPVVRPPPVLIVYPSGDRSLLLQPLLQVRRG